MPLVSIAPTSRELVLLLMRDKLENVVVAKVVGVVPESA
jgi:hypothetical protein